MKMSPLALVALLAACAAPTENNDSPAESNQPADAPIPGAPDSPAAPAAPAPGQPAPNQSAPVPTGSVSLSAAPARAAAGSAMTLTLRNGSSETLGYNLCTSGLQTGAGAAVPSDRICTMELRTLQPAASASYSWELPADLAPGRYRFTTGIEWMDSNRRGSVHSNNFEVAAR